MCFRGEHKIDLGPKAYTITARHDDDPQRSNWSGKSSLMEAIDFALTGRLKKSRRFNADGWITNDELSGFAGIELEDGTSIVRSRRRGKPTQIRFKSIHNASERETFFRVITQDDVPPPGCAAQEDASIAMLKYLAFDADDFRNVAYFESKQMARLIHTEPEKREEIIAGWLGTRKAEAAEAHAQKLVAEHVREVLKLRSRRAVLAEQIEYLKSVKTLDVTALDAAREATATSAFDAHAQMRTLSEASRAFDRAVELVQVYDGLVARGKTLATEVAALPDGLDALSKSAQDYWREHDIALNAAQRDSIAKKKISLGQFDGRCPVASIECPATKQINADRTSSAAAYQAALDAVRIAHVDNERARAAAESANKKADAAKLAREQLVLMRAEAAKRADEYKLARTLLMTDPPSAVEAEDAYDAARRAHEVAVDALADARAKQKQLVALTTELTVLDAKITKTARDAAIATQTRAVFRATQRRISERALGIIGARATDLLSGAGIDLSVDIRWEYEGTGAARSCEDCGAAFPTSVKIKTCECCAATRGQNIVKRLEFLRSDQSDAADDLAGVSLQLAAGSWLLDARQSPWATALLDEPLAACDKTNRRAIAQQLVKLLASGTWRQALVISHSSDTVDAFPGRIEIVIARDGTRRIVQS